MNEIRVGTSGFAYASWKPDFYPVSTPASKFLNYYSTQLNCVEVNYTFRRRPTEKTLQCWCDSTPEGFQFVVKAHQRITHIKRIKDVEQEVHSFYDSIQPLFYAKKLGPVLFQLPPNLKLDVARLREFLQLLPRGARAAVEFRNPGWFTDDVYSLMRQHDVALCVAESDELQVPELHTASFAYYRLRRSDYSNAELKQVEIRLAAALKQRDVYAFVKHEENPASPLNARRLSQALSGAKQTRSRSAA
ncbi:MAG TPA: DUF72 domain-containing protein [candidate division Zixibacteria bacterium]|nr:DUF72 domain-containing protein [candidate division Zixibacteria bacterium]